MVNRRQRTSSWWCASLSALAAVLVLLTSAVANAGGGPENVAVVVNGDSWASKTIANEFVRLRNVPPANVIVLDDLPSFESVSVDVFRERILAPVLSTIEKRGLKQQIDYVVYSSDLPTAINVRPDVAGRKTPRVLTLTASINGLTHLYEPVLAKDVNYLQLNSNRYMRRPIRPRTLKPIAAADRRVFGQASQLSSQKKWNAAEKLFAELAAKYPQQSIVHYNHACCLARMNKNEQAFAALSKAAAAGWARTEHTRADDDLKPLRNSRQFTDLLRRIESNRLKTYDTQPTLAFHSGDRWNERGEKSAVEGRRYLLSTMLAVTSGRGNSVAEAIRALKRSAQADFTRPNGTIYFLVNGNVRSRTREPGFLSAAAALKKLGVKAEIVKGVLPQNKNDVAGAMIGTASFRWPASKSAILPGAICEHLTSFGGMMRERASQTPLTEFLRYGAAGSSGTVIEPFAIQAKFPFPFLHVHYARGCSLAEAFYQSVGGPYQLLIVGDPLCQPWAKPIEFSVSGLKPAATVSGAITITPNSTSLNSGRWELFIDGVRVQSIGLGKSFRLDTRKMADGDHEARVVAIRGDSIETQSRLLLPFVVNNHGHRATLTARDTTLPLNRRVRMFAKARGATSIAVFHNGQSLGTIQGDSGHVDFLPLQLGSGPAQLFAVAKYGDKQVRSAPLRVTVVPPPALAAIVQPKPAANTAGLLLTPQNGAAVVVESTARRDWLTKAGVKPGQRFTLAGEFTVDADDVYQFQYRAGGAVEIKVDGQSLETVKAGSGRWRFIPVHLKQGRHRFDLRGSAGKRPSLEIRFGGRGAQSLDGKRFRHLAPLTAGRSGAALRRSK